MNHRVDTPTPRRSSVTRRIVLAGIVITAISGCDSQASNDAAVAEQPAAPIDAPLLLLISVDQMRADYLERFDTQFSGGLRRLLDEGAVFTGARHGHAITATAPGHAAMLSGLDPRDHGIVDNTWYDHVLGRRERASSDPDHRFVGLDVADDGPGGSPSQFHGSSLVGWLKQRDARSQAVSISRKDRTAVLMAPEAEHVYWWHSSGRFITSDYYREELPEWVAQFNEQDWLAPYRGDAWRLREPEEAYAASRPDDYEGETGPRGFGNVFPHPLPSEDRALATRIQTTPFMDQATLDLGRAAILALGLGNDEVTDVLALGLSSTDSIGHAFGPYSREIHDQMLRLDTMLGEFFAFVDETVGLDRTLVVLTSDHGVVRLPEYSRELGEHAERLRMRDVIDGIDGLIVPDFGGERWFDSYSYGWLQLDREQAAERGADPDALVATARDYIDSLDYVAAVFSRDDLLSDRDLGSPFEEAVRRNFYAGRSGDLYLVHRPLSLWHVGSAANHQSPHDYDRRVPLILRHPTVAPGNRAGEAMVIDLAPTLATMLGIETPETLPGAVLPGF
jgi:predicted AlkP superfamily pyrophosphatase or phosphodiesterase